MRDLPAPVKVLPIIIGIIVLGMIVLGMIVLVSLTGVGRSKNQATQKLDPFATIGSSRSAEIPPCSGPAVGHAAALKPHQHSVTLSWNAAVSASHSPRDAIQGYYVYRSLASHTYGEGNRLSESPLRETRCVDNAVEPRKTYYYVVKSVTEGGRRSAFSVEIKAVIPSF
jgi:hypothetical protein